jgi:hypothetical protein
MMLKRLRPQLLQAEACWFLLIFFVTVITSHTHFFDTASTLLRYGFAILRRSIEAASKKYRSGIEENYKLPFRKAQDVTKSSKNAIKRKKRKKRKKLQK